MADSTIKPSEPAEQKMFIPLENNATVMTDLMHRLGVSSKLSFTEIYSLDDPSMLDFIPRPAYALVFICPSKAYKELSAEEDAKAPVYEGSGADEPIIWFRQTIGNACGLYGLLHAVCNGDARQFITPGSGLEHILQEAIPLNPDKRAKLLYDSEFLENAHMHAAKQGDSKAPPAEERVDGHFICFVKGVDGDLYELCGWRNGPTNRGSLGPDEDMLSEKALSLGVRRFLDQAEKVNDSRFSLIALTPSLD